MIAAAALTALASVNLAGAQSASAAALYPIPDGDAFYAAGPNIGDFQPGDVVRSRTVPAEGFPGATAWQLVYRSTDSQGDPIAATTTLLMPSGGGGRPLVSYQPFVNALGTQCAPSHTMFNGGMQEAPTLNLMLARGWAVAVPDHLGPTSAYGAAQLGGRLTLDGIRAVQRFAPAGLGAGPVGMTGYSGGGMATGFAAALAPSYAPELDIVGVAQGGVPTDIGRLAHEAGSAPNPMFGLGFAATMGLEREYPETLRLDEHLNPAGMALRARMANACTPEIIDAGANLSLADVFTGSFDSLDAEPAAAQVLRDNSLQTYPGVPNAPVYQWHGAADVVSPDSVRQTVGRYCAEGTPVQLDMIPGADHGSAMVQGAPRAFQYLADRFAGVPAPSTC